MIFPKLKFSFTKGNAINIIIHGGSKGIELPLWRNSIKNLLLAV